LRLPPRLRWKLNGLQKQLRQVFSSRYKEPRPRVCPSCGALVGAYEKKCHQCGSGITGLSFGQMKKWSRRFLPERAPVSFLVLGFNVLLFAAAWIATARGAEGVQPGLITGQLDTGVLDRMGAALGPAIFLGQYWRLVTAVFLHANLLHIGFNSFVLLDLGPTVEELYGSGRFFFLYVVTGALGFVASFLWRGGMVFSVGASGALLGLAGVMIGYTTRYPSSVGRMIRGQLIRWLVYILLMGFLFRGFIDNAAHVGGLLSGLALAYVVPDASVFARRSWWDRAGYLATAIVALSFLMALLHSFGG
jgi:membrane associated rhomboid family serine protease